MIDRNYGFRLGAAFVFSTIVGCSSSDSTPPPAAEQNDAGHTDSGSHVVTPVDAGTDTGTPIHTNDAGDSGSTTDAGTDASTTLTSSELTGTWTITTAKVKEFETVSGTPHAPNFDFDSSTVGPPPPGSKWAFVINADGTYTLDVPTSASSTAHSSGTWTFAAGTLSTTDPTSSLKGDWAIVLNGTKGTFDAKLLRQDAPTAFATRTIHAEAVQTKK